MQEFVQSYRSQNVLVPYPSPSNSDCGFEVGDDKAMTLCGISSSSSICTKDATAVDQRDIVDALAKHAIYGTVAYSKLCNATCLPY